ncbi:MAG: zinc ABC transporter substrate-binding protein [Candidatus Eremiobacteraeota bacterium]|nr:zinc ABC transporter substrate-binding protein [Candidatus Eremiobacteraeota bacterium]
MPFFRILTVALAAALAACTSTAPSSRGLTVIATMSTLASIASAVAGPGVPVSTLVPVGASPENYQPTPADIERLRSAGVLIANGAGLESWLEHTIQAAAAPHLVKVVCTDGLTIIDGNPHLWMDPELARAYVTKIRDALISADPSGADGYRSRAADYDKTLVRLVASTRAKIATIPKANREMIIFHDAFPYYNRRFGIRTLAAVELSPGREPNPSELASIVKLARAHHVRAVFAEPQFSPRLMQTLAQSAGITKVAVLYDDTLGTGSQTTDYVGLIDYDTNTIVNALR